jgi:uncharacterized metal-binding protein YceD (DUF177 family)
LKSLRTYSIPFTGLKLGKHQFDFTVDDAFFAEFDYSLVKKANLQCSVELDKQETMIILDFDIKGTIEAACDRCLAPYQQPLHITEQQIARFSEEPVDEDDEIITLSKNDHEINIAGLIYEYINVAIPFISVCENGGETSSCDEEMIAKLNSLASKDEQTEDTDPRWDVLKKINK